ncbi:unnamed protein product [Orchesella dallaii]|uniref:Uncharacterized protein n=1 Tax=Orchesella dallaii TaxID=48710 RepID=A0ABP1RAK2_9HEXA
MSSAVTPSATLSTRYMLLRIENITINPGIYRYSDTFNVIISSLSHSEPSTYAVKAVYKFMEIIDPSRSLFLFVTLDSGDILVRKRYVHELSFNISSLTPIFPALKAIISIPSTTICYKIIQKTTVTIICNSYCKTDLVSIQNSNLFSLHFFSLHRLLFYNANSKVLPGLAKDIFDYAGAAVRIPKICLLIVKSLKPACRADIMSLLIVAEQHNITLKLRRTKSQLLALHQILANYTTLEHIAYASYLILKAPPASLTNQLVLESYDKTAFFYCENNKRNTTGGGWEVSVWYAPFSLRVWASICVTFICVGFFIQVDQRSVQNFLSIFQLLASALGHQNWEIKRYTTVILAIAFLFSVYGNCLLSIVSVVLPPQGIKTVKELLDSNYKILVKPTQFTLPAKEIFEFDFKLQHISEYIDDTFHSVNVTSNQELYFLMTSNGNKFAITSDLSYSELILEDMKYKVGLMNPASICFQLKQTMNPRRVFWKFNTENSFWAKRTQEKIVEAGLFSQWNRWSTWRYLLRLRQLSNSTEHHNKPEYIDIGRFQCILLVCVGLIGICAIALLIEIYFSWKSRFKSERVGMLRPINLNI